MQKVNVVYSWAMPLPMKDVDTDLIIPAQFLTSVSRDGYGENLFKRLRDSDPQFPINQEKFKRAEILVADSNFGCGSSREHAVWALQGAGFRAVISKSFADIFYSNASKNGLLLVALPEQVVDEILKESQSGEYLLKIDLETQEVSLPDGSTYCFEYDSFRKHCMMNGLDDIDYILSHREELDAFKQNQKQAITGALSRPHKRQDRKRFDSEPAIAPASSWVQKG